MCNFSIASNRYYKQGEELEQDRWEDPEGKTRSKVHIVAERVEFKPRPAEKPEGAPDSQGAGASDPAEAGKIKPLLTNVRWPARRCRAAPPAIPG